MIWNWKWKKMLLSISSKYSYFKLIFNYIKKGLWKGTLNCWNCDTLACFHLYLKLVLKLIMYIYNDHFCSFLFISINERGTTWIILHFNWFIWSQLRKAPSFTTKNAHGTNLKFHVVQNLACLCKINKCPNTWLLKFSMFMLNPWTNTIGFT